MTRAAYTYPETAEMFGVNQATIRRMVADGELVLIRLKGSVRITAKSINDLLESAAGKKEEISTAAGA